MDAPIERHPDDLPPPEDLPIGSRIPRGVLWALALLVVLLVIASWVALSSDRNAKTDPNLVRLSDPANQTLPASPGLLGGEAALGTHVPATGYEPFDGGTASLADLAGRPVVVNFWASNCVPCVTEMPALERVHQQLGDKVAFVGLDVQDRDDAARELAARTGVTYPLGFDRNNIVQQLGAIGLPTTVLIDRNGTVVYVHTRAITEDELLTQIRQRLQP